MKKKLSPLTYDEPLRVPSADSVAWHEAADVVVVGFGAAGACSALAAREEGADVLVVERFEGGGATAFSGGVYYGGGTRFQKEAGVDDTPDDMFDYLKTEVGDVVGEATLRRFCEQSGPNMEWLVKHGARFSGTLRAMNAEYMSPGYSLYYSGNELTKRRAAVAKPAPRGHIYAGEGTGSMGHHLFAALKTGVTNAGVRVRTHSPVSRLVVDAMGTVVGVEVSELADGTAALRRHQRYLRIFNLGMGILYGSLARWLGRKTAEVERQGVPRLIRARRGVILSTGGFIHNPAMVAEYLPQHTKGITLGSLGCSGAGLFLGKSMGAGTALLGNVCSSRAMQLKPFLKGLLVGADGNRMISEDAYGALIGDVIAKQGGKAWLILDKELYSAVWKLIMPWRPMIMRYRSRTFLSVTLAARRGPSLDALARKCGLPIENLRRAVTEFNQIAQGKMEDPFDKLPENLRPLNDEPYFAIDCSVDSRGFPPLNFSLGGLTVNEETGQVLREDGCPISRLYAAGRTAVGIPSNFYVSGLSIADCVFSGRRAGKAVMTPHVDRHRTSREQAGTPVRAL